jgi:hypothetical protein
MNFETVKLLLKLFLLKAKGNLKVFLSRFYLPVYDKLTEKLINYSKTLKFTFKKSKKVN